MNYSQSALKLGPPSKWLEVPTQQKLKDKTRSQLMTLCDLKNDGYHKLILADVPQEITNPKSKLKVFKGIGMVSEHSLPGRPTALVSFYTDEGEPKTPIIAVSIGPSILFYRNMKPYFKYTLPSLPINPKEQEVWRKLPFEVPENHGDLIDELKMIPENELSSLSQELFRVGQPERDEYIKQHADEKLQRLSNITAMATINRASSDSQPPSSLILATEKGDIYIIDPQVFKIIHEAKLYSSEVEPALISASGLLDTDFLIVAATSEGYVYLLRKSWEEGREIFETDNPIINLTLLPVDQTIVVTTEDQEMSCYSKKGKHLWSVELETNAKCLVPILLPHLGLTLIGVALANQKMQFYSQTALLDEMKVKDNISACVFGRLGQEDHVLTLVTMKGELIIKILKRTAEFKDEIKQKTPEQLRRARKQKKASKFIVTAIKDKEKALATFNSNQAELRNFHLTVAKATLEAIKESSMANFSGSAEIKLAAEVCGMGPEFVLFITLENLSTELEAPNLRVLLHADPKHYTLPKFTANLCVIEPASQLEIDFEVIAVLDPITHLPPATLDEESSVIRVIIFRTGEERPLIAAIIPMPASEAPLEA